MIPATGVAEHHIPSPSQREKKHSSEILVEPKLQKVKRIVSAEKPDAPTKHLCSDTFGYGPDFLNSWIEEPRTIECKVEPPKKVVSNFFSYCSVRVTVAYRLL